jgi:photosystem II stability/assembly factor-like uncharacterized protein
MSMQRFSHLLKLQFLAALSVGVMLPAQLESQGPFGSVSQAAKGSGRFDTQQQVQQRQKRLEEFLKEHTDPKGQARQDLWLKGIYDFKHMKVTTSITLTPSTPSAAPLVVGVQWTQIGPQPLRIDNEQNFQGAGPDSGQVTDIAIDPRNTTDQVIYIAANDGGIWKSTDGGGHWTAKTDFMPSNSMGAVALDPGNPSIVYAGTGNAFNNGFFKGIGVYRSTDGGDTWTIPAGSSLFNGHAINRIVLPAPGILLVGADNGLFKSVDAGTSYGNNAPNFNNGQPVISGNITDIDVDTVTAGTVYASVSGNGLRRSTDNGTTFGASIFDANVPANFGYFSFAQSTAPNNQTIYVNLQVFVGPPAKIFKSTDGGMTWAEKPNGSAQSNNDGGAQTGYDQTIGVDPQDANRVYIGFQQLYASTDGGDSFSNVSLNQTHWDHHALIFSPSGHISGGPPTRIWTGTDGGVHSSTDGGGTWANLNETIATNLFRQIDIGRGNSMNRGFTYGGSQDTGVIEHRPAFSGNDWHLARDGDGGRTVVDPGNSMQAYSVDDGIFVTSNDGGNSWPFATSASTGLPDCGGNFAGFACAAPVAVDPNNSAIVYVINGAQLFQSTDTAATFTSIHTFPSGIQAVSMTQIDSNTMWIGLANGTVQRTANLLAGVGSTWTAHTVTGAPAQGVASPQGIVVDPSNTNEAVVVYPGFSGIPPTNRTKHVFRTTDNGVTWTDISGTDGGDPTQNLPDLPLHAVVIDPGTSPHNIIVASDAGVARTANVGANWQVLGAGLPIVDSTALAIDASATPALLRVGTYGRSTFELTAATGPLLAVNADLAFGTVCVGQSATRVVQIFNVGSSDLHISSFTRVSGSTDFAIISGPQTPVTVPPGEEIDYTIRFSPTAAGSETATFQINSDDPNQPALQLQASGFGATTAIAVTGSTDFGNVCPGTSAERTISVCNVGACDLHVTSASLSCPDFTLVNNPFPATVSPDSCLNLVIRFTPTSPGPKSCTLTISSDDPNNPVINLTVTGNTPSASIDVPLDATFPPTVIQSIGPCHSANPFPISNTGSCNLTITNITIGGINAGDYSLAGLPSFPIILEPGHIVGEGALNVVFSPTAVARERRGTVSVTYESDPITHATTTVTRMLCGEGVKTGARVLVTASGVPLASVDKIQLQRLTVNKDSDVVHNAPLQTVTPTLPCSPFQFHREYGTVSNPIQLLTGSYQLTVQATINGHKRSQTAAFGLGTCDFNPNVVVNFP